MNTKYKGHLSPYRNLAGLLLMLCNSENKNLQMADQCENCETLTHDSRTAVTKTAVKNMIAGKKKPRHVKH